MPKNRSVKRLLYADEVDMGGIPVRQPFPTQKVDQIDPFLLLHHGYFQIPATAIPHKSGIGPHPHRGFSPVTFVFKGGVRHRDSQGNDSTIYAGGTQWMNAARGIIHSERPPEDIHDRGDVQEIIQLWINIPAAHKMDPPAYYPLSAEGTPHITADRGRVEIGVVAGSFEDKKGPIPTYSPILALRLHFRKGGEYYFPLPETYNAFLYPLNGRLFLEGYGLVEEKNLVQYANDGEGTTIRADDDTDAILMAGAPLNEPVASYGPFVMSNQTEVLQAMRDYQMGKMGVLIED